MVKWMYTRSKIQTIVMMLNTLAVYIFGFGEEKENFLLLSSCFFQLVRKITDFLVCFMYLFIYLLY